MFEFIKCTEHDSQFLKETYYKKIKLIERQLHLYYLVELLE